MDSKKVETTHEQMGVVMTHQTLRLLGTIINESLAHYEEASGKKIELPEDKLAAIKEKLANATSPGA
jgi:hypothetical protein